MANTCGISWGDGLAFLGALIGAGAGIGAAFLAVARQQAAVKVSYETTIRNLIARLRGTAEAVRMRGQSEPDEVLREVHRGMSALKDTAHGMRTTNAGLATLASRMDHTTLWEEVESLQQKKAYSGPTLKDFVDLADDIDNLCTDLEVELEAFDI